MKVVPKARACTATQTFICTPSGARPPQHDAIGGAAHTAPRTAAGCQTARVGRAQSCAQRRARSHHVSASRTAGAPQLAADTAAAAQSTLSSGVAVSC